MPWISYAVPNLQCTVYYMMLLLNHTAVQFSCVSDLSTNLRNIHFEVASLNNILERIIYFSSKIAVY